MPSIDKINIWDSGSRQNIKDVLGYAIKKRNGYYRDIKMVDEKRGYTVDSFELAGFLHIGETLNQRTFGITDMGDQYYKDVFGKCNYYSKFLAGKWERFKNKLFNKDNENKKGDLIL
jgi:hypothetical protein